MTYNHQKAEKEWAQFIAELRKILKDKCPEKDIRKLIDLYREDFRKDRTYYEHERELSEKDIREHPVFTKFTNRTYEDLLDDISDPDVYRYCRDANPVIRSIVVSVIKGFSIKETAEMLGMSPKAVSKRFTRFIKNMPKVKE